MNFIKKLLCKHDWWKIDWRFAEDENTVYSMRHYECVKCGKRIWVDGRYDTKSNCDIAYYEQYKKAIKG